MASTPNFASGPRQGIGQVSAANPNRDGTGTIVNILTAGASGSRIDRLRIKATATTTAGTIRIYVFDGTNIRLLLERIVAAIVPGAAVAAFEDFVSFTGGLQLPATFALRASTEKAETFNIAAEGADY